MAKRTIRRRLRKVEEKVKKLPKPKANALADLSLPELTMRLGVISKHISEIQDQARRLGEQHSRLQTEWTAISQEMDKR